MRAPRGRAHGRRPRHRGPNASLPAIKLFMLLGAPSLRYCGIMTPIVEGAVTRARDSARPATGFPRRHALGVSGNAVHGRSCPLWDAALPWLPISSTVRGPSTVTAPFLMMMPRGGARRADEVFETHNRKKLFAKACERVAVVIYNIFILHRLDTYTC